MSRAGHPEDVVTAIFGFTSAIDTTDGWSDFSLPLEMTNDFVPESDRLLLPCPQISIHTIGPNTFCPLPTKRQG